MWPRYEVITYVFLECLITMQSASVVNIPAHDGLFTGMKQRIKCRIAKSRFLMECVQTTWGEFV